MSVASMALLAVCAALLGTPDRPARPRSERLATVLALGLALFLWLPYLSARAWGIERGAWIGFGILALLASAGAARITLHRARGVERRGSDARPGFLAPTRWWPGLCLLLLAVALGYLLFNLSLRSHDGGLWSAGNSCEDMGLHATLANAFLHSHERILRPTYPIFPGWPLGYPFLPDFAAATAMAMGSSIGFGFFATAAFALVALLGNLYSLARRWLPPACAVLAIFLFLFGGNLGIVFFLRDLPTGHGPAGLPHLWLEDYANNFNLSLNYGNMTTDVLLPMRTSLFGVPIALAAVSIVSRRARPALAEKIVAGLLLGSLPLVNAHSLLAASLCATAYVLEAPVHQTQRWWPTALVAAALGGPQLYWIHHQMAGAATPFIRRADGFLFDSQLSWPTYWLLNGGLFVPLGIGAWFFSRRSLRRTTLPLLLLLPLSMAVSFQPYPFDNIKLLLFFHLGCALLIADLCRRSVQAGRGRAAVAAAAVLVCTATGILSWIREANVPCQMATAADREFAAQVLATTDEHSMILTAQQYIHPVPLLAGRTIVLGCHNWLGQHGIPYEKRAADVAEIYSGSAWAPALIAEYGITDIVVGPAERREFPGLNEDFLASVAQAQMRSGDYTMYRLRR
jgi:hypothetical protein